MKKDLAKRSVIYVMGLFIMTLGVSISVKSNLGVSPVSSIPYTMTCVWGIEMGRATIIFHIALVLLQIAVLCRKFKPINLLQVPVGVMFGAFTTFCNHLMTFLPTPENIVIRLCMMLVSTPAHSSWNFLLRACEYNAAGRRGRNARHIPGSGHRIFHRKGDI